MSVIVIIVIDRSKFYVGNIEDGFDFFFFFFK